MKTRLIVIGLIGALTACAQKEKKQIDASSAQKKLFLDVHDLGPGKGLRRLNVMRAVDVTD